MAKNKLFSKESALSIMAEAAIDSHDGVFPVTSCHSTVGYWIANEPEVEPTDEIVLLGPDPDGSTVYHSILMRGDDIIGDTERAAPERQMDTKYDPDTGQYTTKMFQKSTDNVTYYTLDRMSVAEFRAQYGLTQDAANDPEYGDDDGPNF